MQIGCFYFKRTASGNLVGEFSDNEGDSIYAECADIDERVKRDETDDAGFAGKYFSTWRQGRGKHLADLIIERKTKDKLLYTLTWKEKGYEYSGHGMLCDGMLIGNYIITEGEE